MPGPVEALADFPGRLRTASWFSMIGEPLTATGGGVADLGLTRAAAGAATMACRHSTMPKKWPKPPASWRNTRP